MPHMCVEVAIRYTKYELSFGGEFSARLDKNRLTVKAKKLLIFLIYQQINSPKPGGGGGTDHEPVMSTPI